MTDHNRINGIPINISRESEVQHNPNEEIEVDKEVKVGKEVEEVKEVEVVKEEIPKEKAEIEISIPLKKMEEANPKKILQ